jgi:uncharacterized membrane protein
LLASLGVAAWYWSGLPARVPMHFNVQGKVDSWGPKWTVWLVPVVGVVMAVPLTVLSLFPHTFNYPGAITPENAERQYRLAKLLLATVKLSLAIVFCTLELIVCRAASAQSTPGVWFAVGSVGGLFAVIAAYLVAASREVKKNGGHDDESDIDV